MIKTIYDDGTLEWECAHCKNVCTTHANTITYLTKQEDSYKGAVMQMPPCLCGAQCFLKADYTLSDLKRETLTITNQEGQSIGYALKIGHVHNLMLHHWLYQHQQTECTPLLELPTELHLSDPRVQNLPATMVLALWFGHAVIQGDGTQYLNVLDELPKLERAKEALLE